MIVLCPTAASVDWTADGIITSGEYSGSNVTDQFSVYWKSDSAFAYIGMSAKSSGWVAIAFQPGRGMKGSDMIMGIIKDGKTEIRDMYSTDNLGSHPNDTELGGTSDILEFGGKEEGGITILEFKRKLNTGDSYDISITEGVNNILWSFSSSENTVVKHDNRGYMQINLK